jgi:hydroxyacylglutathione hydrolase
MLRVIQIPVLSDNYIYLIVDEGSGLCACVDPAVSKPVISMLKKNNLHLDYILNTHHHSDHIGANLELQKKYNCQIIGNEKDKDRIPGINLFVKENSKFSIGSSEFKVFEVSGHTIGHICYYFEKDNIIFCGDTLFSLGCGRLFEGSPATMVESLLKIRALPDETKIYCAHEYTLNNANFAQTLEPNNEDLKKKIEEIKKKRTQGLPTIPSILGEEKKLNPFLRFDDQKLLKNMGLKFRDNTESFRIIRELKDDF